MPWIQPRRTGDGPVIDLARALDLLAAAVAERAASPVSLPTGGLGRAQGLVEQALTLAGHGDSDTRDVLALRRGEIRTSALGRWPGDLTLGAVVVLDAAHRSDGRGETWDAALERATDAAIRFLELVPERVVTPLIPPTPVAAGQAGRARL